MFDKYLDEFMPSLELREYLKKIDVMDSQIANIIYYAMAPLEAKRDALSQIEKMDISKERKEVYGFWHNYRRTIEEVLSLRNVEDAIFIVYVYSIYGDSNESDEWMQGVYSSYKAAYDFVMNDAESKKDEKDQMSWYVINLRMKGESDAYIETCDYYIIEGKLCYCEFEISNDFHESCTDGELSIPVSYKPGDILIADEYPFGQKVKFVMLQIGDNMDCCCLQALSKRENGSWDIGAVKHGMIGSIDYPRVSSLYTAKKYIPDLSLPGDVILAKASELVAGEERKGSILWDKIYMSDTDNDEKMWKLLNDSQLFQRDKRLWMNV